MVRRRNFCFKIGFFGGFDEILTLLTFSNADTMAMVHWQFGRLHACRELISRAYSPYPHLIDCPETWASDSLQATPQLPSEFNEVFSP